MRQEADSILEKTVRKQKKRNDPLPGSGWLFIILILPK